MNNFAYGIQSKLPEELTEGQIKVSTDTHCLWFDIDGKRIRITDFETVDTLEDLENILAPIDNMYYYVKENNSIYKYDNRWKMLFNNHFEDEDIHVTKEKQEKWNMIDSLIWVGTKEEFETAKTDDIIKDGQVIIFTDDESDLVVEDQITENSLNTVTSKAIYNAISNLQSQINELKTNA